MFNPVSLREENNAISGLDSYARRLLSQRDETGLNVVADAELRKRYGINPNLKIYGGPGQVCPRGVTPDGQTCDVKFGGYSNTLFDKVTNTVGKAATVATFAIVGAGAAAAAAGAAGAGAAGASTTAASGATTFAVTSSAPTVTAVATGGGAFVPTAAASTGGFLATAGKFLSTGAKALGLLGGSSSASETPSAQADVSPVFSAPWTQPGAPSEISRASTQNDFPFVLVFGIALIAIAALLLGRK